MCTHQIRKRRTSSDALVGLTAPAATAAAAAVGSTPSFAELDEDERALSFITRERNSSRSLPEFSEEGRDVNSGDSRPGGRETTQEGRR